MASSGSNTEKPTPQRVKKAREEGQFVSTRGLTGALQFAAAVILIGNALPKWADQLKLSTITVFQAGMAAELGEAGWFRLLRSLAMQTLLPVLWGGAMILALVVAVHLGITQMGFSMKRLTPKFSSLNPIARVSQLPAQHLKSLIDAVLLIGVMAGPRN